MFQLLWDFRTPTMFYISAKLNISHTSNNIDFFMNVGNWMLSWTKHVVIYLKCLPKICNKWMVLVIFLNNLWGGAHQALFPRFFSFWASPSILRRFAPSTRASQDGNWIDVVRNVIYNNIYTCNASMIVMTESSFVLDSRALHALDSGLALNFRLENLVSIVWPPKN